MGRSDPRRLRPGGRTAAVGQRSFAATIDLLKEVGYGGLTLEAVSTRAGVNRTSLYRRWGNKAHLVGAALHDLTRREASTPDTGDVRNDLVLLVLAIDLLLRDGGAPALAQLAADALSGEDELARILRAFWAERLGNLERVLERASGRGQVSLTPDARLLSEHLFGPVHLRILTLAPPLDANAARELVGRALLVAARESRSITRNS